MRRIVSFMAVIALSLLLSGCISITIGPATGPVATTAPAEISVPPETTVPIVTTTTPETEAPTTEAPTETPATENASLPYLLTIDRADQSVFAGPGYD